MLLGWLSGEVCGPVVLFLENLPWSTKPFSGRVTVHKACSFYIATTNFGTMRLFLTTTILLLLAGQPAYCQRPTEFAVTYNNDTIVMYGPFDLGAPRVYYDHQKKRQKLPRGEVKEVYIGSTHYLDLPNFINGAKMLQRVVMMSDNYLLTSIYETGQSACLFNLIDRRTNEGIAKMVIHSVNYKHDLRSYETYLEPYFGDCPEILEIIKNGIGKDQYANVIEAGDRMFRGVSNFDCAKLRKELPLPAKSTP